MKKLKKKVSTSTIITFWEACVSCDCRSSEDYKNVSHAEYFV